MITCRVHTEDPFRLRILLPSLAVMGKYPVYGRVIYSAVQYPSRADMFLVEAPDGVNLDTYLGLKNFLTEVDYFGSPGKLARFEKMGAPPLLDNYRRVVKPSGRFWGSPDMAEVYTYCVELKIANRSSLDELPERYRVLDILEKPLYERILMAEAFGPEKFISQTFNLIYSYRKGEGLSGFSRQAMARLSAVMTRFSFASFKATYALSGEMLEDAGYLACFFG